MTALLAIALGGAVGAAGRYLTDRVARARWGDPLLWGTVVVNLVGCFVLGLVLGWDGGRLPPELVLALQVGLCGAFTTYSTFAVETARLLEERATSRAALLAVLHLGGGLAAAALGLALSS